VSDPQRERAHLRPLPKCRQCGAAASEQIYDGFNSPFGTYCSRHAKAALKRFKERGRG
jgi:hypothetical protein